MCCILLGGHVFFFLTYVWSTTGSNLGPLLFNIFINDIVTELSCNVSVYADDAKLVKVIESEQDVVSLQDDLDKFVAWCVTNKLDLNPNKCVKMSFHRGALRVRSNYVIDGIMIRDVSGYRDLGVYFEDRLSFVPHINNIVSAASKTLGYITRVTKDFRNIRVMRLLFMSLVAPKLEYASLVWSPMYRKHVNVLEQIQKRFLKYLSWKVDGVYPERGADFVEMCARFDLLTLRREGRFPPSYLLLSC